MASFISYIAALLCFLLALFGVAVGIDLTILGLAFVALGLLLSHLPGVVVRNRQ